MSDPVSVPFASYDESIPQALDQLGAREFLAKQDTVLLKPNLVIVSPHPVTSHPDMVAAMVEYVREAGAGKVVIGEGTGEAVRNTWDVFEALGYTKLAKKLDVELIDLNEEELVTRPTPNSSVFPEMHLPKIAFEACIVSLPVLKAHSLAVITGTLKNMMGFAPPEHYSGVHGSWKKAVFHGRMQGALKDLNSHILPQLTVMDASVGLADYHLGGATCDPPVNKILAGYDPYKLDHEAARLLGIDPGCVSHLNP
ncbi:MAG: DUF362 domain-containing protein [Desulfovibrio sp.]|nr:MAG: DUF362 domain-containing protein [Desulfovibrio sp.]